MQRDEYLVRAREFCLRGEELPQSKLSEADVLQIRSAAIERERLRRQINDTMSNEALANQFNVSKRCIERILSRDGWSHLI